MIDYNGARPRNDCVLVKQQLRPDEAGKISLPQASLEAKEFLVMAIGGQVQDLNVGDKILMAGSVNVDYGFLPGSTELLVIREKNIMLVLP